MRTLPVLFLPLILMVAHAQEQPVPERKAPAIYRVDITLRDGSAQKARHFSMLLEAEGGGKINSGTRLPVRNSKGDYTYIDVGVNVDCRVRERGGLVLLSGNIEISNAPPQGEAGAPPAIRQIRSNYMSGVQPDKPAVIARITDPEAQTNLEIEAVAHRM
jgi:hypothetical protein